MSAVVTSDTSRSDSWWWQQLQAAGVDVAAAQKQGPTPLHAASQQGLNNLVTHLLQAGAQVDVTEEQAETPLYAAAAAASEGHAPVVQQLVGAGAALEAALSSGFT